VDWYWDEDGDGWGGGAPEGRQCAPPDGAVERGGDCDDGNPDRHPGAEERCNSIDDDCDGFTDEGRVTRYYRDADGDGFGTPFDRVDGCDLPAGFVPTAGDCDDGNGDVRPDQLEFFAAAGGSAGFDYDCDGAETRERSSVAGDCSACTAAVGGWAGAVVPGCGETGTWLTCRYDVGTGCHEQFRLAGEVQRCR
ncbi:MAG: putative metal-binding motif-containing protein, partial [Deltaproteobacteria bacterium]|nr:putative metal-binding motif-containing protein [Deltaproteobacteria bacterium]